jgi:hypothetical protein
MLEINPMAVVADCIEKSKVAGDPELIGDYVAEALGLLQIDNRMPFICSVAPSPTPLQSAKRMPLPSPSLVGPRRAAEIAVAGRRDLEREKVIDFLDL